MLTNFFDKITRLSLRFRVTTIVISFIILGLGAYSMTLLNQELIPPVEFPQTIVIVQWPEYESADQFLEEITIPLEETIAGVDGVINVESTTNSTFAYLIARYDFGLNSDNLLEALETAVNNAGLPPTADTQLLNFSLSDLPVVIASVSSSELSLPELKALMQNELQPAIEGLDEVSRVAVSGGQELPDPNEPTAVEAEESPAETEPTATAVAEDPGRLPQFITNALAGAGVELEYAQDLTLERLTELSQLGQETQAATQPDISTFFQLFPQDLLPYLPGETIAYLPSEYIATLDAELVTTLNDLAADFGGTGQYNTAEVAAFFTGEPEEVAEEPTPEAEETAVAQPEESANLPAPEPVDLPAVWISMISAQMGQEISTTADLTPNILQAVATMAPQQMADLTPEMWRAIDPEITALVLPSVQAQLDPDLLLQLQALVAAATGQPAPAADLPESWQAFTASLGMPITNTATLAQLPPETFAALGGEALPAELLADLTPELLLALPPALLAQLPPELAANLDEGTVQTLTNILIADARYQLQQGQEGDEDQTAVDAGTLPEILVQGLAQAGINIETADQITPDMMRMLAGFGPQATQALALLTPDNLRLLQPEVLALLPADFVATLDADLKAELDELAADFDGAGALALAEAAEETDPGLLPEILVQGLAQAGIDIETADQITPDMMRMLAGFGPQATQALALLTPDNLRLLQPEVLALLPADFVATLDADLKAELDELAADFDGAGALALAEAAQTAVETPTDAPPLTGMWVEAGQSDMPITLETAHDLINNGFVDGAAALLNLLPQMPEADLLPQLMADLSPEVVVYLVENEEGFLQNLSPNILELLSPEVLALLLETYPDQFDAELAARLQGIASGNISVFIPEASITRTNGDPAVLIQVFKGGDQNTVRTAHAVFEIMAEFEDEYPGLESHMVFEQATFIEESIAGVSREGALGAVFAVIIILIFLSGHIRGKYRLSWQATLIAAVSIPLSIFTAFLLMQWIPVLIGQPMQNWANSSGNSLIGFVARLFPSSVTLNIMTLSGLTVAIGRVVDDSIVVLENSYRHIQQGKNRDEAIAQATREVAIAIFSATVTTMVVFLPLGFVGGIIGSVFMPFGLTVAWALAASFVVSITLIPALTSFFINKENIPEEKETMMQRWYTPALVWALKNRAITMVISAVIFVASLYLLGQLPQSFIPAIGEPTVNVSIQLPSTTSILDTNTAVEQFEASIMDINGIEAVQTEVGGAGGLEAMFMGGGISQNLANLTISVADQNELETITREVRAKAEAQFGAENATVSAASQAGFGGFSLLVTGNSLEELMAIAPDVKAAIASVDIDGDGIQDIANVNSSVDELLDGAGEANAIYIRIDGRPAISFGGELETQNTLGVTAAAKEAIQALDNLPATAEVSEGFESQQQVEGVASMLLAISISIVLVYIVMAVTFHSLVLPFVILFSLPFALVGAAIALYITNSVLGISALIGFMMLVGIVTTNGIVLMELVEQLRAGGMDTYKALIQGGRIRLRPIWMTALAAILALIPLAASSEAGAIIASELARAVMGGLLVSTLLTLIVVPVVFYLFEDATHWVKSKLGRS